MAEPIRVGIIGFGRQGESHAKAIAAMPDEFRLTAACDVTPSRQEVARQTYGMRAADRVDEVLKDDVELVFVTSHSSMHHQHTLAALQARKHCMVEKPFAVAAKQAAEMVAAARANGVLISCFHNRRWDDDVRVVRHVVQQGTLGDLFLVENRTASRGPAVGFGTPDFNQEWRITASMGGGTIFDFGPHWFDQVLSLLPGQKVAQVFADVRHLKWGDADDYFDVKLVFDGGCRATVSKCDVAYVTWPKWIVLGSEGSLRYADRTCTVGTAEGQTVVEQAVPGVDLFRNLHAAIREGQPLAVTGDEAMRNIQLIEASFESARQGRSIAVEI